MAGANGPEMAIAVSEAGGLGSLPCAMLTPEAARAQIGNIRQRTDKPFNLNFFVHAAPRIDAAKDAAWAARLKPYYDERGLTPEVLAGPARAPFEDALCSLVEEARPRVVSFHFGLPAPDLLARVKAAGAYVLSSATTVREALWLEANGADAIIAQGAEAGGHRGMFLSEDVGAQPGLFALLPQVADGVRVPVIAAGAVADARGIAAAFTLGAHAVQIGTAYLFTPEATISPMHRARLASSHAEDSVLTNVLTGRPARSLRNRAIDELGPIAKDAPGFPLPAYPMAPLRAAAEKRGSDDFSPLWSGQSAALGRAMGAGELTHTLWREAQALMR